MGRISDIFSAYATLTAVTTTNKAPPLGFTGGIFSDNTVANNTVTQLDQVIILLGWRYFSSYYKINNLQSCVHRIAHPHVIKPKLLYNHYSAR